MFEGLTLDALDHLGHPTQQDSCQGRFRDIALAQCAVALYWIVFGAEITTGGFSDAPRTPLWVRNLLFSSNNVKCDLDTWLEVPTSFPASSSWRMSGPLAFSSSVVVPFSSIEFILIMRSIDGYVEKRNELDSRCPWEYVKRYLFCKATKSF